MSIIELKRLLERLGVTVPVYPYEFPLTNDGSNAVMINTGDGIPREGDVQEFLLTVVTRGSHPIQSETLANDVAGILNKKTDIKVGNHQIILIRKQQPLPMYAGKDEAGRYYHTADYRIIMD